MIIYEKRGTFRFRDSARHVHKFPTLQDAIDAGGIEDIPEVAVSGVPYKVKQSEIKLAAKVAEDLGDK